MVILVEGAEVAVFSRGEPDPEEWDRVFEEMGIDQEVVDIKDFYIDGELNVWRMTFTDVSMAV